MTRDEVRMPGDVVDGVIVTRQVQVGVHDQVEDVAPISPVALSLPPIDLDPVDSGQVCASHLHV